MSESRNDGGEASGAVAFQTMAGEQVVAAEGAQAGNVDVRASQAGPEQLVRV